MRLSPGDGRTLFLKGRRTADKVEVDLTRTAPSFPPSRNGWLSFAGTRLSVRRNRFAEVPEPSELS